MIELICPTAVVSPPAVGSLVLPAFCGGAPPPGDFASGQCGLREMRGKMRNEQRDVSSSSKHKIPEGKMPYGEVVTPPCRRELGLNPPSVVNGTSGFAIGPPPADSYELASTCPAGPSWKGEI